MIKRLQNYPMCGLYIVKRTVLSEFYVLILDGRWMRCEYWNIGGMMHGKTEIRRHELFPVTL